MTAVQPAPRGRASVVRNAAVLMGSQATTWVLALALTVVMPRYLGAVGIGQFRVAISLWAIADTISAFGTSTAITIAMARDEQDGSVVGQAIVCRLILYVVSFLAVLGFAYVAGYDSTTVYVIIVTGIASLFGVLYGPVTAAFYGLERMGPAAFAEIAAKFVLTVTVITVLLLGGRVEAVVLVSVGAAAVSAGIATWKLRRVPQIRFWGSLRGFRGLMRASWPYLVNDATLVLYMQVDTVVISLLATEREVGWYAAGTTLFGSLTFIPVILMTSLFPVFARVHHSNPGELRPLVGRTFAALMLVATPIALGVAVLAAPMARLLYGGDFVNAGPVLAVMGFVLLLTYPTILLGRFAIATGRQRFWGWLMLSAALLSIPLDLVLVPWTHSAFGNGALGAALAYIVTELMIVGIGVRRLIPDLFDVSIRHRLAKCALAGALMTLCIWPLRGQFVLVPITVGFVVYVLATWLLRTLDGYEQSKVRGLVASIVAPLRPKTRSMAS